MIVAESFLSPMEFELSSADGSMKPFGGALRDHHGASTDDFDDAKGFWRLEVCGSVSGDVMKDAEGFYRAALIGFKGSHQVPHGTGVDLA